MDETKNAVKAIHKAIQQKALGRTCLISKNRVESLSHDKLESQFSFLRLRDFGDGIDARREVFIPIVFRTPTLHITQHSLEKVVSEEISKGLILLGIV